MVVFALGAATASDFDISSAVNWCVTNKNGVGGGNPIRILSMSLGGGQYFSALNSGILHNAAGTALSNDILVFGSSGNDGWGSSMGSPAASSNVISVGSVFDETQGFTFTFPGTCSDSTPTEDERVCYSNTASFLDVYAPSEDVVAAQCGGGTALFGGTSAACPAAAGLCAQLLSARPQYIGDKSGIVSLFQSTGAPVLGDGSKRRINLTAAIGVVGNVEACFETDIGADLQLGDDDIATNQALGFTFSYPGGSTTAIDVCSNGFFYLQTGSSSDTRFSAGRHPRRRVHRRSRLWSLRSGRISIRRVPGRSTSTRCPAARS